MQMADLLQLVKRYVNRDVDYSTFRGEFVKRFLSVRNDDFAIDNAIVLIESLCADVAEGEVRSETDVRDKLKAIVDPVQAGSIGQNPVQFLEASGGTGYLTISSGSTSIGANSSLQTVF